MIISGISVTDNVGGSGFTYDTVNADLEQNSAENDPQITAGGTLDDTLITEFQITGINLSGFSTVNNYVRFSLKVRDNVGNENINPYYIQVKHNGGAAGNYTDFDISGPTTNSAALSMPLFGFSAARALPYSNTSSAATVVSRRPFAASLYSSYSAPAIPNAAPSGASALTPALPAAVPGAASALPPAASQTPATNTEVIAAQTAALSLPGAALPADSPRIPASGSAVPGPGDQSKTAPESVSENTDALTEPRPEPAAAQALIENGPVSALEALEAANPRPRKRLSVPARKPLPRNSAPKTLFIVPAPFSGPEDEEEDEEGDDDEI
jgi:hypothetical protein